MEETGEEKERREEEAARKKREDDKKKRAEEHSQKQAAAKEGAENVPAGEEGQEGAGNAGEDKPDEHINDFLNDMNVGGDRGGEDVSDSEETDCDETRSP